ncbi:MAG: mechanosensitive ion channel [Thermomonas sp.]
MTWQDSLQHSFGSYLPSVLGAVAILLVGWIVALIAAGATRKGLGALRTNERLAAQTRSSFDFERFGGRIVFWALLLLTLIGVFSVLHVDGVSGPLSTLATTVMMYLPRLLLALVLALVAWLIATLVRTVVNKALGATRMDEKLSESADMQPLSNTMGNVAYWLVLLLFLPAIVGALQIDGLMIPLSNMTAGFLAILPNLFAAVIIGVVGWIIAKAVRGLVTNLLAATGIDRFSETRDETRGLKLSQLGGTLAFILVIVPTLIAALDALRIEAISAPLTNMLGIFLAALPNVLAAAAILILAWFIGRFVAELVAKLLANLGFDRLPERIGLGHAFASSNISHSIVMPSGEPVAFNELPLTADVAPPGNPAIPAQPSLSLSELGGRLALFFIMLFATVEAAGMVGFDGVHGLLEDFIAFGADVLLGLVIFLVGFWLADLAAKAVERANPDSRGLAQIARVAILGLVLAMGLRAMGVADDIVNLAFGLILGAIAVAVALAFGLGGRDAAGTVASRWANRYLSRQRD